MRGDNVSIELDKQPRPEPTPKPPGVGYQISNNSDFTRDVLALLEKYGYKTKGIKDYTITSGWNSLVTLDIKYNITTGDNT